MKRKALRNIFIWISCSIVLFCFSFFSFNFLFPIKYKNLIKSCCAENNLDSALVASLIHVESHYNKNAISKKGAVGLMQIMPETANSFYNGKTESLEDPKINIEIGTRYLGYLFSKYNDETTVLACYNAGEMVVLKWMECDLYLKESKIKYKETANYVKKVMDLKKIYNLRMKFI